MEKKKELENEQLEDVNGGIKLNLVSNPNDNKGNDGFYGPSEIKENEE